MAVRIEGKAAPTKGRASVISAVVVCLAVGLTSCASHSGGKTAGPEPPSAKTSDTHLPDGWARFSYGSLSVGAPAGWKVSSAPLFCGSPPNTVNEYTLSTLRPTSCPSYGPDSPTVEAVAIECLRGQAGRLYSGTSSTTVVEGKVLYRQDTYVYQLGSGWEGVVLLPMNFGPLSTLGTEILATVKPTGRPC